MNRWFLVVVLTAGCSFDQGAAPEDGSKWKLDSGVGAADMASDSQTSTNNSTNNVVNPTNNATNNVVSPTNNSTNNTVDPIDAGPDLPTSVDAGMDVATQPDLPVGPCQTNSDCPGQGNVCCPQIAGDNECKPQDQCRVSGTCEDNGDCQPNDECCPLPALAGGGGICAAQCFGNGGNQTPCADNSECTNGLICCTGFNGNTCSPTCLTGGVCGDDSDCASGSTCCDVRFGDKQCLSRCF